jgi:PKD repeat protein
MTACLTASREFGIASSANDARLYLDPTLIYVLPGETFTAEVKIADVLSLYSWQVNMSYDPTVLQFENVTEGEFLKDQPEGTLPPYERVENELGWVIFQWVTKGKYEGVSGSGTLATVRFQVDAVTNGETVLNLTHPSTFLLKWNPPPVPAGGSEFEDIPFEAENGFFTNLEVPPVADFSYSPSPPVINEAVTFDASDSSAVSPLEIVGYEWRFGDGTNATGVTVQHTFAEGGDYTVTLIVIDNATPSGLMQLAFDTVEMPLIWYELYGSTSRDVSIVFAHDIAVTDISVSSEEVTPGTTISISAEVSNLGSFSETFSVVASYDSTVIETKPVTDLASAAEMTVTFSWDTTGVAEGEYQISVEATGVQDDGNPGNNNAIYEAPIKVGASNDEPVPTTLIVAAVGIIAVLGAVAFLYMRRRGAKPPD